MLENDFNWDHIEHSFRHPDPANQGVQIRYPDTNEDDQDKEDKQ